MTCNRQPDEACFFCVNDILHPDETRFCQECYLRSIGPFSESVKDWLRHQLPKYILPVMFGACLGYFISTMQLAEVAVTFVEQLEAEGVHCEPVKEVANGSAI